MTAGSEDPNGARGPTEIATPSSSLSQLPPMKFAAMRLLLFFSVLTSAAGTLSAQEVVTLPASEYPRLLWTDIKTTATAPARWDRKDWLTFSVESLAVVGTAAAVDRPVRDWTQRNTGASWEKFANRFEPLGAEWSFAVIGAFYLDGRLLDNPRAENTAVDALSASIVAAGIVSPILKIAAGRARPNAGKGVYSFKPFSGGKSFPSGHTTQAFAIASVVASHYHSLWVAGTAYTAAGLVGLARIDHNAHFASDVLAGAIIGTTIGRATVRLNEGERLEWSGHPVTLAPMITPDTTGLLVSVDF